MDSLARAGYHQLRNAVRLASGCPVNVSSLFSTTLDEDDVDLARHWLRRSADWYRADEVIEYQRQFARWNGSEYALSFMGARVALSACIHALRLQPGDEVLLPGYTCVVVPNAFHYARVNPIYCDIELETYGLDAARLEEKITSRTKAVLLHHLYGLVSRDYELIVSLAREHHLWVIEDCAQSTGAEYKGTKVGNLGDVAIYSSEHSKVFNTVQGGIASTNDADLGRRLKQYQDLAVYPDEAWIDRQLHTLLLNYYRYKHRQRWWRGDLADLQFSDKRLVSTTQEEKDGCQPASYVRKMPAPVAALGQNQLRKLDYYNEKRRQTAERWNRFCDEHGYRKPLVIDHSVPVYLRYPVLVEPEKKQDRKWARNELHVELGVWFLGNIHPTDQSIEGCPNADVAVRRCVQFPGCVE
jgi:dTDP-4-amino-4,6-dideoxygalactose transaminase